MKGRSIRAKKSGRKAVPSGQLRRSQLITTFGPGAMLDLPSHSVLVGGLDHWRDQGRRPIHDRRLQARICELLEVDEIRLETPPVSDDDPQAPPSGITCFVFPAWFLAQVDAEYRDPLSGRVFRSRPLVHWNHLDGSYKHLFDGAKVPVVPVRFVQACANGHVSDIDWHYYVHSGKPPFRGPLWMDEGGSGGDLGEIFIRCERSGKRRSLADAKLPESHVLGQCQGDRPWIRPGDRAGCKRGDSDKPEWNRLLVRSASNAYFSQSLRVISIPEVDETLRSAVSELWEDELKYIEDLDDLVRLRRKQKPPVVRALGDLSDDAIWEEIERRRQGLPDKEKPLKQAEIEMFLSVGPRPVDGDTFSAERRALGSLPPLLQGRVDAVVLIHKLREIQALIGFTRFEAVMPDVDGELSLDVRRAALAEEIQWVPAIDNPGEGVFISFDREAIDAWLRTPGARRRGAALARGFEAWKASRGLTKGVFPGAAYAMLHALAHLLIQTVSLECGYAAAAITERIYAGAGGYGILLYTGTTGSEGTLGGLVGVGRRIEHYLALALEQGRLCSNDPICAQHRPDDRHEERYLHGAACHGCLLIAEPSCERRNELLDRALVVPTVDTPDAAFFSERAG